MEMEISRPTITTSRVHLAVVVAAFRRATTRDEMIAIAEKHKPHMPESDIASMREYFKKRHHHNQGETA